VDSPNVRKLCEHVKQYQTGQAHLLGGVMKIDCDRAMKSRWKGYNAGSEKSPWRRIFEAHFRGVALIAGSFVKH
jgi:hypothetical protein